MYHDWTKGPAKEEPLLSFKGVDLIVRGEIHVISGQTATCKSLFALDLISVCLNANHTSSLGVVTSDSLKVLLVDTEQSSGTINSRLTHVLADAICDRGLAYVCNNFTVLKADALMPHEAINRLVKAIGEKKPDIVIVDGIVDLTENFNDPCESRRLVQMMHNIAVAHNIAVVSLIHENPHSDKARGHLGTILQQKCWRAWSLERVETVVKVTCVKARGAYHSPFAFSLDSDNLLLHEVPVPECVKDKITCRDLILLVLQRGPINRYELYKLLAPYKAPKTIDNEVSKLISIKRVVDNKDTLSIV